MKASNQIRIVAVSAILSAIVSIGASQAQEKNSAEIKLIPNTSSDEKQVSIIPFTTFPGNSPTIQKECNDISSKLGFRVSVLGSAFGAVYLLPESPISKGYQGTSGSECLYSLHPDALLALLHYQQDVVTKAVNSLDGIDSEKTPTELSMTLNRIADHATAAITTISILRDSDLDSDLRNSISENEKSLTNLRNLAYRLDHINRRLNDSYDRKSINEYISACLDDTVVSYSEFKTILSGSHVGYCAHRVSKILLQKKKNQHRPD